MATVTYDKATRVYPGTEKPAVDQLEISIEDGEFLVLVGPSGCGKSTSLRMLAGLEDVNGGSIRIGDRDVTHLPPKDRDIAMVFQNYALYPHMTVADNMGFALKIAGVNKSEIRQKVEDAAKILDLTEYLGRKPKALSGGQRQRVAMGRAIVREPQVFLMDEPLSNLDAKLRVQTRTQIAGLQRRLGITTVYVTHDQVEAMTMGDRVAVLKDGLLQQVDSPRNMYDRPNNLFVAGFIGSPAMNLVEVPITDGGVKFGNSVVPVSREALSAAADKGDRTVTVGVRPEHFDLVDGESGGEGAAKSLSKEAKDAPAGLPVTVNVVEELGADGYVYGTAEVGSEEKKDLVVRVNGRRVPEKGAVLRVVPRPGELHVFSTSTGERLTD
ncbi:sn-glycerol-3-phosphate ABC transporter ATP-binding protein UgpC [Streptomyces sp. NPDC050610]|uniref:ABC transporter ATP-binding protein n=1 Tax=Streptomyces sp. NPDC050610 TaxID=3157097 RepID=UPI00342A409F